MVEENIGIYRKYVVRRVDGKDAPGEKHGGCEYFVLDLSHDRFAVPALRAYAEACKDPFPVLSKEIFQKIAAIEAAHGPWYKRK